MSVSNELHRSVRHTFVSSSSRSVYICLSLFMFVYFSFCRFMSVYVCVCLCLLMSAYFSLCPRMAVKSCSCLFEVCSCLYLWIGELVYHQLVLICVSLLSQQFECFLSVCLLHVMFGPWCLSDE